MRYALSSAESLWTIQWSPSGVCMSTQDWPVLCVHQPAQPQYVWSWYSHLLVTPSILSKPVDWAPPSISWHKTDSYTRLLNRLQQKIKIRKPANEFIYSCNKEINLCLHCLHISRTSSIENTATALHCQSFTVIRQCRLVPRQSFFKARTAAKRRTTEWVHRQHDGRPYLDTARECVSNRTRY